MYTSEDLVQRIKELAKNKGIRIRSILDDCDLSVNTLNQITDKKGLSSVSLAKIADYLDCSVDYLLGRTDDTQVQSGVELRVEEYPVIARYRSLSDEGRVVADKLLDKVFETDVVKKNTPTAFSDERIVAILQDRPELTELAEYLRTLNRDQTLQAIGCIQQLLQQQNGT